MAKTERRIVVIHTDDTVNTDKLAKTLANVITGGDSTAYINKIIANRDKLKASKNYINIKEQFS